MNRLILHVGTHKTGTTSIQRALKKNRGWLLAQGFTYPAFDNHSLNHSHIAHRLAMADEVALPDLREELLRNVERGQVLVVSSEEFSARIVGREHWHHFDASDYWCRKRDYLARIRELVRAFDEVDVLVCFRRQDEFAESLYATILQRDRFRWSFEEFRERCAPIFDYQAQLREFRNVFNNVRVMSFERLKPDLVSAFLTWAGIPVPPDSATLRLKATPDLRLIYWLYVRGRDDDPTARMLRARFCRAAHMDKLFAGAGRASLWRSNDERLSFLRRCTDPEGVTFACPEPDTVTDAFLDGPELQRVDISFQEWRRRRKR